MKYTIYIFKPEVTKINSVLATASATASPPYVEVPVTGVSFPARAYIQRDKMTTPPWLGFVLTHCAIPDSHTVSNRSNSFIVALQTTSGRVCALTYGQGFMALNRSLVQQNFGLEAACRLLESKSIKEIESKAVGFDGLHKLQISSKPGDLAAFPLQRAKDHVHRLGGTSNDATLGKRITGATSCMLNGLIAFSQLGEVCDRLVSSIKKKPKARLAALKPYERVDDKKTIEALNGLLLATLVPRKCQAVGIFLPDAEDWRSINSFEVSCDSKKWKPLDDLDIEAIVDVARNTRGSSLSLEQLKVRGLTDSGSVVLDRPIAELATMQTPYKGKPFALKDGSWFELDQRYYDEWKLAFRDIQVEDQVGYMPDWTSQRSEGAYNDGVARKFSARFCSLDRKGVDADGNSVEVADLVTVDGHFIHVKTWKSSQTFSALVKQGLNSAQLIAGSQLFRDSVLAKIPLSWRKKAPWKDFGPGVPTRELRIVYAIADAPKRTLPDDLPFFSRLSLYDACAALRQLFFEVRVVHIVRKRGKKK